MHGYSRRHHGASSSSLDRRKYGSYGPWKYFNRWKTPGEMSILLGKERNTMEGTKEVEMKATGFAPNASQHIEISKLTENGSMTSKERATFQHISSKLIVLQSRKKTSAINTEAVSDVDQGVEGSRHCSRTPNKGMRTLPLVQEQKLTLKPIRSATKTMCTSTTRSKAPRPTKLPEIFAMGSGTGRMKPDRQNDTTDKSSVRSLPAIVGDSCSELLSSHRDCPEMSTGALPPAPKFYQDAPKSEDFISIVVPFGEREEISPVRKNDMSGEPETFPNMAGNDVETGVRGSRNRDHFTKHKARSNELESELYEANARHTLSSGCSLDLGLVCGNVTPLSTPCSSRISDLVDVIMSHDK